MPAPVAGSAPGSVLLQMGQRSMKRLCRQKVGMAVRNSVEEGRESVPGCVALIACFTPSDREQSIPSALRACAALDGDVAQVVVEVDLDRVALGGDVALAHRCLV